MRRNLQTIFDPAVRSHDENHISVRNVARSGTTDFHINSKMSVWDAISLSRQLRAAALVSIQRAEERAKEQRNWLDDMDPKDYEYKEVKQTEAPFKWVT